MTTLVSESFRWFVCGVALGVSTGTFAQSEQDDVPDLDFLEYLGIWEESDEDWQLLDEDTVAENREWSELESDRRSDPAPAGKESAEIEDES